MRASSQFGILVSAAMSLFVVANPSIAGVRVSNAAVDSGVPTRIWRFYNCHNHIPSERTAFVDHGRLDYRQSATDRCGNANEPVREIWYTSPAGYHGADSIVFPGKRHPHTIILVTVR